MVSPGMRVSPTLMIQTNPLPSNDDSMFITAGCRTRRTERGAAAVEMALVAPLLLALVFGIISFGTAYNTKISLTAGVREGARLIALGDTNANAIQRVKDSTPHLSPALASSDISILENCPPGSTTGKARVQANYSLEYNYLFKKGTWDIQVEGVMRCGL